MPTVLFTGAGVACSRLRYWRNSLLLLVLRFCVSLGLVFIRTGNYCCCHRADSLFRLGSTSSTCLAACVFVFATAAASACQVCLVVGQDFRNQRDDEPTAGSCHRSFPFPRSYTAKDDRDNHSDATTTTTTTTTIAEGASTSESPISASNLDGPKTT